MSEFVGVAFCKRCHPRHAGQLQMRRHAAPRAT
eukprot:CAMPEP_0198525796 /NCGR_PEP_ID=MMETSP1462-20131121/23575_1 /TAXON_ID=1333877 /ORGANISM="Brandtodinium nutriculum, Strain RCC3387" /LENGTH=32 /DNA_ID= /DNA_START= /DNA_END= /DNA_ORIENTATION=